MKRKIQKGFTIVELVIVIAVIAVLASVLIPSFSNIIRKAQISADVQLCRNLNTVLSTAEAEGRVPGSVYDVLYLENEAGYIIENLNPTSEGYYYAWDQERNEMIYLMEDLETVYFPEEYTLKPENCWVTIGSAEEAAIVAKKGFNLALERDIQEEIVLTSVVSINTLGFKCTSVTFQNSNNSSSVVETAYMIGDFGTIGGNIGATSIVTSGSANTLSVAGASTSSVTVGGYVGSFSTSGIANSVVSGTGLVSSVAGNNTSSITNNGVVVNKGNSSVSGGSSSTANNVVNAGTKEDLDSIRTQVSTGHRDFNGETVKLSQDVNLNGIAFTPIANVSRENGNADTVFKGVLDGQGYSINNFSTSGFSITGLNAGTNDSTPRFGSSKTLYKEAVYGLFGVVKDATFKNINVTCNVDMVLDSANSYVGDSVGGIVGCAFGEVTFENCTVSGNISGYDGVGGFLGRLKGSKATFINCTNNANVTGVRKTGGFIGSTYEVKEGAYTVIYKNCVNNGNITSLGVEKDIELVTWDSKGENKVSGTPAANNYSSYYTASASNGEYGSHEFIEGTYLPYNHVQVISTKEGVLGFINTGVIKVGSVNVGNGTYMSGSDKKSHYAGQN